MPAEAGAGTIGQQLGDEPHSFQHRSQMICEGFFKSARAVHASFARNLQECVFHTKQKLDNSAVFQGITICFAFPELFHKPLWYW